jgi:thiamine-monophosphate kinase
MGEFDLIDIIKTTVQPPRHATLGIGDDAAVIAAPNPGSHTLLCSDCMVEGIHFDLSLMPIQDVAFKAVAAALSDIAAMNGKPVSVVISLALSKEKATERFIKQFYQGVAKLQQIIPFDVVGGDLSASPGPLFIDVAATGESAQPITRAGAKPGDILAVSGFPGLSAAGLYAMKNWKTVKEISGRLMHAHTTPKPRFDLALDPRTCHALIDISDGLASEAHHIANASHVALEIKAQKIPLHERARAFAQKTKQDALAWALYGGEDYELLGAFAPDQPLPDGFTAIGLVKEATEQPAVTLVKVNDEREPLAPRGFDHFA